MGTRLRHILGPNLKALEKELEAGPQNYEIRSINKIGNSWYVHFVLKFDQLESDPTKKTKVNVNNGTKTIVNKKSKSRSK